MEALGSEPLPEGGCSARTWASNASTVTLEPEGDRVFAAGARHEPGADCRFERALLRLRRDPRDRLDVVRADEERRVPELTRGTASLVAGFRNETVEVRL